jgi:hypothetical protein
MILPPLLSMRRLIVIGVFFQMARWPSGQAEVCKTFHTGSIPVRASTSNPSQNPIKTGILWGFLCLLRQSLILLINANKRA